MEHTVKDLYEMHVLVKGKVQGVGFRASTHYYANSLGLKGSVCNLPDGSVEIYAQGSKRNLEELVKRLRSDVGQIEEASIEYFPIEHPHENFKIIY